MEQEFKKYSNEKGKIVEDGLKKIGVVLDIDIYEDVILL